MLFPLQTYLYCFLLFFVSISIAEYSQNFKNNITVGERFTNLIDYPRKPLDCDVGKIKQLDITKEQIEAQGWKVTASKVTYDFATVTEIDDWLRGRYLFTSRSVRSDSNASSLRAARI